MVVDVILLKKLKESPICRQIGLERSMSVGKLRLCTPPTIFVCFALAKIKKQESSVEIKSPEAVFLELPLLAGAA